MGNAKKISRTIARAFDKFYGDSAPAAAGELARTLSYSGIPYIFYMTRSIPADSVSMEIFDQVDSLLDIGQTDAAKEPVYGESRQYLIFHRGGVSVRRGRSIDPRDIQF